MKYESLCILSSLSMGLGNKGVSNLFETSSLCLVASDRKS